MPSKTKDPASSKKIRQGHSAMMEAQKLKKTYDFPHTRHLKVCLGFSGFGGCD